MSETSIHEGMAAAHGSGHWGAGSGAWAAGMDRQEVLIQGLQVCVGGGHGGRHLGCRDGPTGGALRARLTYGHVVTVGAALSYTPAVWPPLQTHLMYSHVFTIGLCFLVARVMTPWQRVMLHLDRWGGVLGGACLDHRNVTTE